MASNGKTIIGHRVMDTRRIHKFKKKHDDDNDDDEDYDDAKQPAIWLLLSVFDLIIA